MSKYYDHPFTLSDPKGIVSLEGIARFWANGSDTDVWYFHPMTGSRCERIDQALAGFSEQESEREAAWAELQKAHEADEYFLANLDPPSIEYLDATNGWEQER